MSQAECGKLQKRKLQNGRRAAHKCGTQCGEIGFYSSLIYPPMSHESHKSHESHRNINVWLMFELWTLWNLTSLTVSRVSRVSWVSWVSRISWDFPFPVCPRLLEVVHIAVVLDVNTRGVVSSKNITVQFEHSCGKGVTYKSYVRVSLLCSPCCAGFGRRCGPPIHDLPPPQALK